MVGKGRVFLELAGHPYLLETEISPSMLGLVTRQSSMARLAGWPFSWGVNGASSIGRLGDRRTETQKKMRRF